MKNTLIKKGGIATAILGFGLMLSACGGGGGGSTASVVPSTFQGAYTGALQSGDFASFYVSGNTLSYTVTGTISTSLCNKHSSNIDTPYAACYPAGSSGTSITGTLSLTPLSSVSGTNYFEATAGSSTVYVFLSGNTGIFTVPSLTAAVVGYKDSLNNESISSYISSFTQSSHTFIYAHYKPTSKGSIVAIYSLTVNTDHSFSYYNVDLGYSGGGCWMIDPNNSNRIIAVDGDTILHIEHTTGTTFNSCDSFTHYWSNNFSSITQDYNVIVNPFGGITVDYTNYNKLGKGVGVGVQVPLSLKTGSYTIKALDFNRALLFTNPNLPPLLIGNHATESITVSITSTAQGLIGSYTDLYTHRSIITNSITSSTYTGSLTYGTDCYGKSVPGIISAVNNARECYDIFFDPSNNYYLSVLARPLLLNINNMNIFIHSTAVGAIQK